MKFVRAIDNAVSRVIDVSIVVLFVVMLTLAVVQVFLRYFFNGGILWGDVAARTLVIWVGFLGAMTATREAKHFSVDVLTRFLKMKHQFWLQSISSLFAAVICFFLAQAGVTFLGLESGNKTFLDLPAVATEVIVPIGFYLMAFQFLLRMVISVSEGVRNFSITHSTES